MSSRAEAVDLTELDLTEDGALQEEQEQQQAAPTSDSNKKRRRSDVVEASQGDNHKSARVVELERNNEIKALKHKLSIAENLERNLFHKLERMEKRADTAEERVKSLAAAADAAASKASKASKAAKAAKAADKVEKKITTTSSNKKLQEELDKVKKSLRDKNNLLKKAREALMEAKRSEKSPPSAEDDAETTALLFKLTASEAAVKKLEADLAASHKASGDASAVAKQLAASEAAVKKLEADLAAAQKESGFSAAGPQAELALAKNALLTSKVQRQIELTQQAPPPPVAVSQDCQDFAKKLAEAEAETDKYRKAARHWKTKFEASSRA